MPHPFAPTNETRLDAAGRPYRICATCGKGGRGRGHSRPDATSPTVSRPEPAPRPIVVLRRVSRDPDWRLFAAYHAIVHAQEVRELDAGLEHALRVASRELDYLLHRRPEATAPEPAAPEPAPPEPRRSSPGTGRKLRRGIHSPDVRRLFDAMVAQGWTPRPGTGSHVVMTNPAGEHMTIQMIDDGNPRGYLNLRASARRLGVVID